MVEALQQKGKRVSVISTLHTQPPMVADELRRQADQFIDLSDMANLIGRDPSVRAQRDAAPRYAPARTPVGAGPVVAGGRGQDDDDFPDAN